MRIDTDFDRIKDLIKTDNEVIPEEDGWQVRKSVSINKGMKLPKRNRNIMNDIGPLPSLIEHRSEWLPEGSAFAN